MNEVLVGAPESSVVSCHELLDLHALGIKLAVFTSTEAR
jgi:hypothetical protein